MANKKSPAKARKSKQPSQRRASLKSAPTKVTKKQPINKPVHKSTVKKSAPKARQFKLSLGAWQLEVTLQPVSKPKKRLTKKQKAALQKRRQKFDAWLLTAGLAGTAFFAWSLVGPVAGPPAVTLPPTPEASQTSISELPLLTYLKSEPKALSIPAVGINTELTTVGQNIDGTLEVPASFETAAWYRGGPTPGEIGPAIIVGHVDSFRGPAVFWRLSQLVPDQTIEITRTDGSSAKFKVTSVQQFDQDNFPTAEVYGNIDHAGLRLITCGGRYNRLAQRYSHNTVVFASLVN